MNDTPPLRISLHTGGLFRHDAVSSSLLAKLDAVADAKRGGAAIEARALVSYSEVEHPNVVIAAGAYATMEHPWFRSADVCAYEYGIWYEAFDTVFVAPPNAATIAFYHNVTPPGLARRPEFRRLLERSLAKKSNLTCFHHVACDSSFSRNELLGLDFVDGDVSVVPLPPSIAVSPDQRSARAPGVPVELLYVGRFVSAKGVLDLLAAVHAARGQARYPFRLRMAGNEHLSDPDVLAEVRRLAATPDLVSVVNIVGEVEDDELATLYANADALVLPSYHEGYCVPVVESISAGAHVITSDAGNLPNIVNGVGRTVPVGDVAALADAIATLVTSLGRERAGHPLQVTTDHGVIDAATWRARVEQHRREHSVVSFRAGFWRSLSVALAASGRSQPLVSEGLV